MFGLQTVCGESLRKTRNFFFPLNKIEVINKKLF